MDDQNDGVVAPSLDFQRLRVISALGRGAKGVVFLVQDEEAAKFMALKVLRRFDHPLLPKLHGVLDTEKLVGYAIDYCPGRDLNCLRKRQTERMFSDDVIR
ncbi:serine/threonine-protein kinase OXI1 [Prunus yedoensis var. nudiflora]|uniref:non-specific serine/threonine protein kinase n=1 Tax=Prunus yedoensis var. nudiflora TaxID=2094558 RepID=A0A314Z9K7_PRUYE|nr:serine/threonine-protein kinase OXI1 [Prunus yedoensis var. nudiflora]